MKQAQLKLYCGRCLEQAEVWTSFPAIGGKTVWFGDDAYRQDLKAYGEVECSGCNPGFSMLWMGHTIYYNTAWAHLAAMEGL